MESTLETLSIELVEMIVAYLSLDDIASLRLASRTVESKASRGRFTTFFTHRNVALSTRNLQEMIQVTERGRPACLLQHCIITGIAQDGKDEKENEAEHTRLLTQAFDKLKHNSPNGAIASLSLSITVIQGPYLGMDKFDNEIPRSGPARFWTEIWDVAVSTFNIVTMALIESQLHVHEHFDVFGTVKGCSLDSNVFQHFVQLYTASHHVFKSLKKLTLSLSAPHLRQKRGLLQEELLDIWNNPLDQTNHSRATLQRLPLLFRFTPALESLDLHWRFLDEISTDLPLEMNDSSAELVPPLCLQHCALRGAWGSETDILGFIQAVQPASLTLIYVRIIARGTWDRILNYLTDADSPVTQFHLDDICQGSYLVHYNGIPGTSKFRYRRTGPIGPSTITRSPTNAKEPLEYDYSPRHPMGSGERYRWRDAKVREFGSPGRFRYNFVELNAPPPKMVESSESSPEP